MVSSVWLPPAIIPGATQCRLLSEAKDGVNGTLWNLDGREGLLRNAIHELALLKGLAAGRRVVNSNTGTSSGSSGDAVAETSGKIEDFVPRVQLAFVGTMPGNCSRRGLFIVTDAWDLSLTAFMDAKHHMDASLMQSFSRQLIAGVGHLHSRGVVHRLLCRSCMKVDLQGNLRVSGLHSACAPYAGSRPMCTSPLEYAGHYKAPELMLGMAEFSPACDMWAVGAIVACMCRYMKIVQETWPNADQSEIALLFGIFQRLGTPVPPHPLTRLPAFSDQFPKWKPIGWDEVEPSIGSAGARLLTELTDLNPFSRLTASQGVQHAFFSRAAGPDEVEKFDDDIIQEFCPHGREDWRQSHVPAASEESVLEDVIVADVQEDSVSELDPWHKFQCSAAQCYLAQELQVEREEQARHWTASMSVSIALRRKGSRNMLIKSLIFSFLYAKGPFPSQDLFGLQTDINGNMRAILVDWLVDVCGKYGHDFGTLCLAVNIIDQHIAQKAVLRKNLQLLGVAAFLLATKVLGDKEDAARVNLQHMSYITAAAYTPKQVQDMEEELLPFVGSTMMCWGPYHFLSHFIVMLKLPPRYAALARFCLLQSLLPASLSAFSGSLRAAAACTIALKYADDRQEMPGTFKNCMESLIAISGRDKLFLKQSAERMWVAVHSFTSLKALKKKFPDAWKLVDPAQNVIEIPKQARDAGA